MLARSNFFLFAFLISVTCLAQGNGFPYGQIEAAELIAKTYERDSSATALMLKEFGEAYLNSEGDLVFEHHYLIKILKTDGLEEGNIKLPLYKTGVKAQRILSIQASSYNFEEGRIVETAASGKNIFTENVNKNWEEKKVTIPNVKVGSIIEVQYTVSDPFFVSKFHPWPFQSHIPKASSEFWATIPANYDYNITWIGSLPFTKREGILLKECFDLGGPYKADCARYKFAMKNIPAFIEEEYMTAKSNFASRINFELSQVKYFNGKVEKITKEWKDADLEVKTHDYLGDQLKKGKDIFQSIAPALNGISDPLEKAKVIVHAISSHYTWNGYYGKFSEDGIKKAFDQKTGNIADINLSLIAALRYAELNVEPVLLSTRANGLATELHPVLTDFNYVVAKLIVNDKSYLLDASDPLLPFGMLPHRCLNGKGRAFPEKAPSYWCDLQPTEKNKWVSILDLAIQNSGQITGTIEHTYMGYEAYEKRKKMLSFPSVDEYVQDLARGMHDASIKEFEISGLEDYEKPIKLKLTVEMEGSEMDASGFLLNPFFNGKMERNPFRLSERVYPIDFGTAQEHNLIMKLSYPSSMELEDYPEKKSLVLPGMSGKLLYDIVGGENSLTMNYVLSIGKPVFNSNEYQSLKSFFDYVVEVQNGDLLFRKKK